MPLIRLDISDFRNLVSIKLEPSGDGFNLLYGDNGSGKTSLLEAIYYLSLGRSFRSSISNRIIHKQAESFSIFGHITNSSNPCTPIGIERWQSGDVKMRISGKDVHSTAELANLTPVQLINSHCYSLLDAGPIFRRKYMDWGAFYLTHDFLRLWQQFERALKQRNAALRSRVSKKELTIWTQELIEQAIQLDQLRRNYFQFLLPQLLESIDTLLILTDLDINYYSGWNESVSYETILAEALDRDMQLGYTQFGPHRADLKVTINRIPAKDILSRGQQKLFVCAMILAQGALLQKYANRKPIYLVDDLPSELDMTSRSNLISLLSKQKAQVFMTAVQLEIVESFSEQVPIKVFHVEHGNITEVSS